jgi:hypothetical protein
MATTPKWMWLTKRCFNKNQFKIKEAVPNKAVSFILKRSKTQIFNFESSLKIFIIFIAPTSIS